MYTVVLALNIWYSNLKKYILNEEEILPFPDMLLVPRYIVTTLNKCTDWI